MPTNIEVCYVRREQRDEHKAAFLGSHRIRYEWYIAEVSGKVIAQTNEVMTWDDRAKDILKLQGDGWTLLDQSHQKMIQSLLNDDWEVLTADERGKATSLKRQLGVVSAANPVSPTELLKQLASLRDAGILTETEYQAKKAEILKRI